MSYKRETFERMYASLTVIQNVYSKILHENNRQIGAFIPESKEDFRTLNSLEKGVAAANLIIDRLEGIKRVGCAALLTEGSIVKAEEIGEALEISNELIEAFEFEAKAEESNIVHWGRIKVEELEFVKKILLNILDHKIKRTNKLGKNSLN